jgi:hypothetical protein
MDYLQQTRELPIGTSVSDNFAPGLRSEIFVKEGGGVWLTVHDPVGTELYRRFVSYGQLDRMMWGV